MRSLLASLIVVSSAAAFAQEPARTGTLTLADGVYTNDQAGRGERLYQSYCAYCHGPDAEGKPDNSRGGNTGSLGSRVPPALRGDMFIANWVGLTLGDLLERIRISMPQDRPGSLSRTMNADILAFLLATNGYRAGTHELPFERMGLDRISIEQSAGLTAMLESPGAHAGTTVRAAIVLRLPSDQVASAVNPPSPQVGLQLHVAADAKVRVVETVYPIAHEFRQSGKDQPLVVVGPTVVIGVKLAISSRVDPQTIHLPIALTYEPCSPERCFPVVPSARSTTTLTFTIVPPTQAVQPRQSELFDSIRFAPTP